MTKIEKFGSFLNKYYFQGKKPACASMSDMATLTCVYNDLKSGHKAEFVESSVKTILENMEFIVAPKGIGYIVIC